jgi:uronate dehydrogenase
VDGLADPPVLAEVTDAGAVRRATEGVDAVLHLAGLAEAPSDPVLATTIEGTFHVFDAARRAGVSRVVHASGSHPVGFVPGSAPATADVPPRPSTYSEVSMVFGEALGRLMVDRYGLEVVCLRIGSWKQYPTSVPELSTWISPADGVRLLAAALTAPDVGFAIVYGISANTRARWDLAPARALGYLSVDDAEEYADQIPGADADPDPGRTNPDRSGAAFAGPAYDEPRPGRET